jgi:catechol 2,3-dioxygenase-like lactoylglutathione lyase family enzyme
MGKWYTRPVLFVSDVEQSSRFYVESLGYSEAWRHADDDKPLVAQVPRAGSELILSSQQPDKVGSALTFISLDPDELGSVRADFEARGVNVQDGWWGYKLMVIVDPDGNQLFFPYPAEDQE